MDRADSNGGIESAEGNRRDFYTWRVRKSVARMLGALVVIWLLWKEGESIYGMFRDLFDSVRWLLA